MAIEKHQVLEELRKQTQNNLQGDLLDFGDTKIEYEVELLEPAANIMYVKQVILDKKESVIFLSGKSKKDYNVKYTVGDPLLVFEIVAIGTNENTPMPIKNLKPGDFVRARSGAALGEDIDANVKFTYKGRDLGRSIGYMFLSDVLDKINYVRRIKNPS